MEKETERIFKDLKRIIKAPCNCQVSCYIGNSKGYRYIHKTCIRCAIISEIVRDCNKELDKSKKVLLTDFELQKKRNGKLWRKYD